MYTVESAGTFSVFRETVRRFAPSGPPVVLIVGFRLKLIGSNPLFHWLFQHVCILTTPFWCGLRGFGTKLWLVDPVTKNYFGIYEWFGEADAERYLEFLLPILGFFSVGNTSWSKVVNRTALSEYLH